MTCADNRTFGSDMGFGDDPYVVVSIPEGEYGDISMTSKTGTLGVRVCRYPVGHLK